MKTKQLFTIVILNFLCLSLCFPSGLAIEIGLTPKFNPPVFSEQIGQPLDVTLPHFMTLQKFQSVIFLSHEVRGFFSSSEAHILNVGLNAFMSSNKREALLLEALRKNRSVELKFNVSPDLHATKSLAHRSLQTAKEVPIEIEIQPLLDGPLAFQIKVDKNTERIIYDVNWAGQVVGFVRK